MAEKYTSVIRTYNINIKMDLKEINWKDMNLSHQTLDRVRWWAFVNTVIN
jgi:hypothetical protein